MTKSPLGAGRLPEAVLRPATANVFETTVEQLATAIRLGVFEHGQHLPPERELAERLGVSRNSLRDAIAALRTVRPRAVLVVKGDSLGDAWWEEIGRAGAVQTDP